MSTVVTLATAEPAPSVTAIPGAARLVFGLNRERRAIALDAHRKTYRAPLSRAGRKRSMIDEVEAAGLRGRGGASFPTAIKLRAVAESSRASVVVVNGTEGEPASAKDRLLLTANPHLVLDGALLAADAIGASAVRICIERGSRPAIAAMNAAIAARRGREALLDVHVMASPAHFVTGEETALVHWLNGGDAVPTGPHPRPVVRGVNGRPTLVDNVETLAHLAQIHRFGVEWFRALGTHDEPGSVLATVTPPQGRRRVVEAAIGTPLTSIVAAAGGTLDPRQPVLVGGYFGAWITGPEAAATHFSNASLRMIGGSVGCGVIAPLPPGVCAWCETTRMLQWMAGETAGQCGVCVNGLAAIANMAGQISEGSAPADSIGWLHRWADQVEGRGGCRLPDGAVRLLRSALRVHATSIEQHLGRLSCPYASAGFLPFPDHRSAPWQ